MQRRIARRGLFALNTDEMFHLVDHAADRRCVFQIAGTANLVQTQPDQRLALRAKTADGAPGLRHTYCFATYLTSPCQDAAA